MNKHTLELTTDLLADLREVIRKADACACIEKHKYGVGQDTLDACGRLSRAVQNINVIELEVRDGHK